MKLQSLLERIRDPWVHRVSHDLARGTDVRETFENELTRFFNLFEQALLTGDPSWIDPVLYEWSNASTESDLSKGQHNISTVVSRANALTFEVVKENLSPEEALELLTATSAIFSYALSKTAHYESDARVSYISNELAFIQDKMEKLDRSKSNFISVAAHELKTPLTLIEGYSAMIVDMVEDEMVQQLLEGVHGGVLRLRKIVDDMIDVSLIDNGLLTLNLQPHKMTQALRFLREDIQPTCDARDIKLEIHPFEGDNIPLYLDSERIFQAFHNVLSNAIKYTPDGGQITITGRVLPGFIEIVIEDTGIGISLENQLTIFEKFHQLGEASLHSSSRTNFKGGGPGLGLPISRGIIEAHGGTIWVASDGHDEKAYHGASFHILLPDRSEDTEEELKALFEKNPPANFKTPPLKP